MYMTQIPSVIQVQRIKVITAGICAVILTVGIARFTYTPFLPLMLKQTDLSLVNSGWLATFNYIGYLMGVLLVSFTNNLSFKFRFYQCCLLVAVLSTIAMGMIAELYGWVVLRFIAGVSGTAGVILSSGFVLSWLKHHQLKPELGLHFMGLGLGIAIPGTAVVLMNHFFAWDSQWILMGLFGIVFFIPAWLWIPPPLSTQHKASQTLAEPPRSWMIKLILAYACAGVGYVVSATFIVAILENMPQLAGKGDWIWVVLGLAAAPACFLWDKVANKAGEINTLLLTYVLQTVAILIPVFSDSLLANLIAAAIFGCTFTGIVSLMLTFIGHKFPKNPAKAMARLTICYGIAQIIAPAAAGYLASHNGNYNLALMLTAMIMVAGMVFLIAVKREKFVTVNLD
jgi:predicted MFS family arabinose efflux permease